MITLRMHRHGRELLLAAADKDLLGRELRGDGLRLEVCLEFYEGEDASEEVLLNACRCAPCADLVGRRRSVRRCGTTCTRTAY